MNAYADVSFREVVMHCAGDSCCHVQGGVAGSYQAVAARLGGSTNSTLTQHALLIRKPAAQLPRCPQPGGALSKRMFSDKPAASASAGAGAAQPTTMQRLKQMSAGSGSTFRALTQTTGKTSQTVFRQLPEKVTTASACVAQHCYSHEQD
jgi:hypothetical protein